MATFQNKATLSYGGRVTDSNTVTGVITETLSMTKTAIADSYAAGEEVTYAVSLVNAGTSAYTGLTVTDDLGGYPGLTGTLYPLSYIPGSLVYYVNGVLQPAPTVEAGPPLVISGINIPAEGNATLLYRAAVTPFAPPSAGSTITNTATATGGGLPTPLTASATLPASQEALLSITKSICPSVILENGFVTYTFTIQNLGSVPAVATDNAVLTDTFDPILSGISVQFNDTPWAEPANYTYDDATGLFSTVAGQITVPAATYTQTETGEWTVSPGVSVLTVSGTV